MDIVLLSGLTTVSLMLIAMARLIHDEVREQRRAIYKKHSTKAQAGHAWKRYWNNPPPGTTSQRRHAAGRPPGSAPRRPAAAQPGRSHVDRWAPFAIRTDTDLADLRRQYRALARRYHPDRGGDPLMMAQINRLYDQLHKEIK